LFKKFILAFFSHWLVGQKLIHSVQLTHAGSVNGNDQQVPDPVAKVKLFESKPVNIHDDTVNGAQTKLL
jgi:hypothetical protein